MKTITKWKHLPAVLGLAALASLVVLQAQENSVAIHDMHAKGWLAIIEGDKARDNNKKPEAAVAHPE